MNPKNVELNFDVTQKGEELLDAQYVPKIPGPHIISVTFNNQEIPQSPIKVNVEPDVDVGKIKVTGIDQCKFIFIILVNHFMRRSMQKCVYESICELLFCLFYRFVLIK